MIYRHNGIQNRGIFFHYRKKITLTKRKGMQKMRKTTGNAEAGVKRKAQTNARRARRSHSRPIAAAVLLLFMLCAGSVGVYASFGSGVAVIASEVGVVKTGLGGQKIRFSDTDIKCALGITEFNSVTVTSLPSSTEGTLTLAGRRVREGQTIKRKNIGALVFTAASDDVAEVSFTARVNGHASDLPITFTVRYADRINYAPTAVECAALTTQAEIPVFGRMEASDPEGDELEYVIVSFPTNGSITLLDKNDGSYKYVPNAEFIGTDSFCYAVRDGYGNWSEAVRVEIYTTKRLCETVFADMTERAEYNAAVAMSALGVMDGSIIGQDRYFRPDDGVTKAEFVAIAMQAAGIKRDSSLKMSFFDDNDDINAALVGYVATAQRLGIIDGDLTKAGLVFRPNDIITVHEAASVMAAIMGLDGSEEEAEYGNETVPIYARADVTAMCTLGIFDDDAQSIDGSAQVTRADTAEFLYRMIGR